MTKEEKLKHISKLRLIDDLLFEVFAQSRDAIEEIIRVILEDEALEVTGLTPQGSIRNLYGRSVRLDATCTFSDGRYCDVEIQRDSREDHARRVRFNASMLTVSESRPNDKFSDVKNVVIIYISETDIFKGNKTVYHVKKYLDESATPFDDGLEEVFVNAAVNDGSRIAELMDCFMKPFFDNPSFPKSSARMRWLKKTKEGRNIMCEFSQKLIAEGIEKGIEKGVALGNEEKGIRCFLNCLDRGMTQEDAKAIADISDEIVKKAMKLRKKEGKKKQ